MRLTAWGAVVAVAATFAPAAAAQSGVARTIQYGEVVSAEQVVVQDRSTGAGSSVGSTVGAVAGYALSDRGDRWIGGLLGSLVGAAAGSAIERSSKKKKGWELIIRLDGGEEFAIQVVGRRQRYRSGDRVRVTSGGGRTDVSKLER